MKSIPCNLCGNDDAQPLYERSLEPFSHENSAKITTDLFGNYGRIVKCRRCDLAYTNPRWDQQEIYSAYNTMIDPEYLSELECRQINAFLSLRKIKKHVSRGKLLDIGCSTGFLLNAARMDFEAVGLELSQWAAEKAIKELKVDVRNSLLEDAGFPPHSFDVVTMIDVIEHLPDPYSTLKAIAQVIKTDGVLYIVTPNICSLSARVMRGHWWGLRPAHLYYFSPKTLSAMLEKAGFSVVEIRSYGRIFTWSYWLSRLKNYPKPINWIIKLFVDLFDINDKILYLDTRDSIEVVAIRSKV